MSVTNGGEHGKMTDKKELILFFVLTFGLAYTGGMFFSLKGTGMLSAAYMMILPATSVGIVKELKKKTVDNFTKLHYIIFIYFIFIILLNFLSISNIVSNIDGIVLVVRGIGSIVLILYSWLSCPDLMTSKEKNKTLIISILIMTFAMIFSNLLSPTFGKTNVAMYVFSLLFIIPSFVMGGIGFFGEEYGWRGFLQEKLQDKMGKRLGIIVLGIIWEIWHLPLWLGPYQVRELGIIVLVVRFIYTTCMAIFLGWVYMRTHNVWLCSLLHFMNNSMGGSSDQNFQGSMIASIVIAAIMGIFIFTREYRKK